MKEETKWSDSIVANTVIKACSEASVLINYHSVLNYFVEYAIWHKCFNTDKKKEALIRMATAWQYLWENEQGTF